MKKWINRLTLPELKAVTWHYACQSIGSPKQASLAINPLLYKHKQSLENHITNTIKLTEIESETLKQYMEVWNRIKDTATEELARLIRTAAQVSVLAPIPNGEAIPDVRVLVPISNAEDIPEVRAAAQEQAEPALHQASINLPTQIPASVSAPVVSSVVRAYSDYEIDDDPEEIQVVSNGKKSKINETSMGRSTKGVDLIDKWTPYGDVKIEDWMKKIELIKKMWSWTDTQAIDAIQLKLTDPHAFNNLSDFIKMKTTASHQVRLSEVKEYLVNLYQSVISTSIVRSQLYSCKQDVLGGETVTDYSKRFRTILMKLSSVEEAEKVDMYLHGLDVRLKQDVLYNLNRPNTTRSLGVAERLAQEAEIQRREKEEQEWILRLQQRSQSQQQQPMMTNYPRYIYNSNGNKRGRGRHTNVMMGRNVSTNMDPSSTSSLVNQAPKTCWTCGATGHVSSQCYRNPNINGNSNTHPNQNRNPPAFASRGGRGGYGNNNRSGIGPNRQSGL